MAKFYITATELASDYGFSRRYWIRLAAQGSIPGAHQPSGPGGKWVFERAAFKRWWQTHGRDVGEWRPLSRGDVFGGHGAALSGRPETTEPKNRIKEAKRRIKQLLGGRPMTVLCFMHCPFSRWSVYDG